MIKNRYKNIICFGEVLWDMLPSGAKPGGAPLNVAIHLKKLGKDPLLVSKIGNDEEGEKLIRFLTDAGIDTGYIQTDDALPTSKVLIHLDDNKNATYEICEPVAWDNITFNDETENKVQGADLIIYGSLASRNNTSRETLLHLLKASEATRLTDINLRPPFDNREWIEELLRISDFAKLNDDELVKIAGWNNRSGRTEELIPWFSDYFNCPTLCITRGKHGAVLYMDHQMYSHPGFKVDAVDTVGAGDSFLAALIARLADGSTPEEALEFACATGSFVASQKGAVPDYSEQEILNLINTNKR